MSFASLRATTCLVVVLPVAVLQAAESALPGKHPLTEAQAGAVLIAELRCAACHADVARDSTPEKTAPDLSEAGARISPTYLRRFLAAPAETHPGTTMPDVLANRTPDERDQIAEALTHFLVAQSKATWSTDATAPTERPIGQELFHTLGCVACHGAKEPPTDAPPGVPQPDEDEDDPATPARPTFKPNAVPLAHVPTKYSAKSLAEFLFQPLRVRASGRMPDMKLTPAESQAVAAYLTGAAPNSDKSLAVDQALVAKGGAYFRELNCAACHTLPGFTAAPKLPPLKDVTASRGCLSTTHARGPRFTLPESQEQAIVTALRQEKTVESDSLLLAKTFTTFRCIACHTRDDYGGVPEIYNPYFTGSEKKLGDDGRIPPPLTLLGAKLQPAWLKKVLFDGESVRHYMATRMPQYGAANLHALPGLVARLDTLESKRMNLPAAEGRSESERQREKLLRAGGRELLGDQGLNCIACHNFNGKAAPGTTGIDLLTTTQRLQPGWYNSYLRNPGAFRPRTVMPSAWSNGIAAHKTILDGDTDTQIEAIWYYLSLGTSAADPSGIRGVNTKLTVDEQARTYRGRSRVAGFRGIAVGLPEKLSYAFNAETGALTAIWRGEFINVNWNGQGSGDFNPIGEIATLPQDVSFARLADDKTPWPLLPVMTKEARTNPDPLYPKNQGYQFRGYQLGESAIPMFLYRSGEIEIKDRSHAAGPATAPQLKRTLTFDAPRAEVVWFRALTGEVQRESEQVFRSGRVRLTIPPGDVSLRPLPAEPTKSELLLRLPIPAGVSNLELLYEPLPK